MKLIKETNNTTKEAARHKMKKPYTKNKKFRLVIPEKQPKSS